MEGSARGESAGWKCPGVNCPRTNMLPVDPNMIPNLTETAKRLIIEKTPSAPLPLLTHRYKESTLKSTTTSKSQIDKNGSKPFNLSHTNETLHACGIC